MQPSVCFADQIATRQRALAEKVDYGPLAIAYPNGHCSAAAVDAAMDAGLRVGFTVAPQRPRLPLDDDSRMQLGRFFFHGGLDIRRQCRLFGARFAPSHAIKRMMQSV